MRPSNIRAAFCLVVAVAAAVGSAGCFHPDLSQVTVTCSEDSPPCPDGMACQDGICRRQAGDDGSTEMSDAGVDAAGPPVDAAVVGCLGGGTRVGTAWACPGVFKKGEAATLCAAGFSVCKDATGVDTTACNRVDGFFVSQSLGKSEFRICRNIDPLNFICGAAPPGYDNRMRFGCGNLVQPYVLQNCQQQCGSFDRTLDCTGSGADYQCSTSNSIGDDANLTTFIGVLCCPGP